jgi:DNA-binding transcriptional MerR regulator
MEFSGMKMLARIRYLIDEGFELSSISGYDDASGEGNAKLMFVENWGDGSRRVHSEIFDVSSEEMQQCSNLFLEHLARHGEE